MAHDVLQLGVAKFSSPDVKIIVHRRAKSKWKFMILFGAHSNLRNKLLATQRLLSSVPI